MEGDRLAVHLLRLQRALGDELLKEIGVVRDFVLAAEVRIFVLERVEAVRAGGDHAPDADLVERPDVAFGEGGVEELVAQAARRVSAAGLGLAEDTEAGA